MLFTDTVTIYNKKSETEWTRTVVRGVQWSDKVDKKNENGKVSIARYASVTFPEGAYEGLVLDPSREEDCIVCGEIQDAVTGERGQRLSDLLGKYTRSGTIQSVNDNTRRDFLKNIKVVVA